MKNLEDIRLRAKQFARDRDWEKFHSPKNLSMALSVEAAELQEHFQWLTDAESNSIPSEKMEAISNEIADVQVYLVMLADKLGIDIPGAVEKKMKINEANYPAGKVRGSAAKHTEYK